MYVCMNVIIHYILLYCVAEVKLVSLALLCSTYMLVVVMKCMYHFIWILLVRLCIAFYILLFIRCFAVCMYVGRKNCAFRGWEGESFRSGRPFEVLGSEGTKDDWDTYTHHHYYYHLNSIRRRSSCIDVVWYILEVVVEDYRVEQ